MDFDYQWFLLALPVAFIFGWIASRLDLKQLRVEQHDTPQAYFKGLNLLLNEQHDKAIDAFIEAVQHDPDTSDLHFALGNMFRRRGEYDRAVRVHQHLLQRADLPAADRERAQHGLAQDFFKAGLFDRAEEAYRQLEGTVFDTEARLALLTLYERSRDWRAAIDMATKLERGDNSTGSFSSRIAHYWCEIAEDAHAKGQSPDAEDALRRAREAAPHAARSFVMEGQWRAAAGLPREALEAWDRLLVSSPPAFNLVARDYAQAALLCGPEAVALALNKLTELHRRAASSDLLAAIGMLDANPATQVARLIEHLKLHQSLSAARSLVALQGANVQPVVQGAAPALVAEGASAAVQDDGVRAALEAALQHAAKPLQRYRCAACGFESGHYFWQCPGCQGWDTYPPRRLEDL